MSEYEHFSVLKSSRGSYRILVAALLVLATAGLAVAHYMESEGHRVTGMNNQVIWGLPHVFAIFLIVSASGALNVGSISSVFRRSAYKPWSRLSGLLAVSLLIGGLCVLVLDLGRPDRLVVAMTHYNFTSVFAWNIFLYTGFAAVVIVYLWVQLQRNLNHHTRQAGLAAFLWRIVLTSGTGAIFGLLVARPLYQPVMMVPLFILLSLELGTAVFILVSRMLSGWAGVEPDSDLVGRLGRLLVIFILIQSALVALSHVFSLLSPASQGVAFFILFEGGIYTALFWFGQVGVGVILPLILVHAGKNGLSIRKLCQACLCAVAGVFCQLYVLIIGGQAYPMVLFPGKTVSSTFYDGVVARYIPSLPELFLGLGGVAISGIVLVSVLRVLPFLPENRAGTTAGAKS